MGQILEFPSCAFCHSQELGLLVTSKNKPMVMCDECGYCGSATIDHFDQPMTKVSVS